MTKTMTEDDYLEAAAAIVGILNKCTSSQGISLLVGCLCSALEGLSAETRLKNRDLIIEGVTDALDGKLVYGV